MLPDYKIVSIDKSTPSEIGSGSLLLHPVLGTVHVHIFLQKLLRLVGNVLVGSKPAGAVHNMVNFNNKVPRPSTLRAVCRLHFARADIQGLRNQLSATNFIEQLFPEGTANARCMPIRTIDPAQTIKSHLWIFEAARALNRRDGRGE